jgi:CRP-like cAMP-binding protein
MSITGLFPIDDWDFKSRALWESLPSEDLELMCMNKIQQTYAKGETIFKEGFYPSGVFYIIEGKIKKYKRDKNNGHHIIYIANARELIGYRPILAEGRNPDSAVALEDSTVIFIPKEDFLKTLRESKVLSSLLLKTLSHQFTVYANSIATIAKRSVRERLAIQLIILREKYKQNHQSKMPVEITLTRDDLANLVGTARENVIRTLTDFKEEGILSTHGSKIIIYDVVQLIKIADY